MTFSEFVWSALNAVLLVLIPILGAYLAQLVKVKTGNAKLNQYLDIATEAVSKAIDETAQIYVDALKSDGKFTKDEWATAMAMTVSSAKKIMGSAAIEALNQLMGDAEGWISTTAEAFINQGKKPA